MITFISGFPLRQDNICMHVLIIKALDAYLPSLNEAPLSFLLRTGEQLSSGGGILGATGVSWNHETMKSELCRIFKLSRLCLWLCACLFEKEREKENLVEAGFPGSLASAFWRMKSELCCCVRSSVSRGQCGVCTEWYCNVDLLAVNIYASWSDPILYIYMGERVFQCKARVVIEYLVSYYPVLVGRPLWSMLFLKLF